MRFSMNRARIKLSEILFPGWEKGGEKITTDFNASPAGCIPII
jgi:hypothetical protein